MPGSANDVPAIIPLTSQHFPNNLAKYELLLTLYTVSCGTLCLLCSFLSIQVKAEEGKERLESPEASIRAERYQSASPNYLSISIPHSTVAPGDTLPITLNDIHQSGSGNIGYFYYMVKRIVSYQ